MCQSLFRLKPRRTSKTGALRMDFTILPHDGTNQNVDGQSSTDDQSKYLRMIMTYEASRVPLWVDGYQRPFRQP